MLYDLHYRNGTKKTVILLTPLSIEAVEAQVKARPDAGEIVSFEVDPLQLPKEPKEATA